MKKILVVDDLEPNRILLRKMLLALNDYEVVEAVNGREAVEKFREEKPDLVLMDIMMPDGDGFEAASEIKSRTIAEYTPIIFLTALSAESALSQALASGGDDFISKPFNVDILKAKINAHLRIRELNQQLNENNILLAELNNKLENEHELIEHFFDSTIEQSFLDENIIRYSMSSLSTFNGDVLFVQRSPTGSIYLIIGDFTGHGLTAAMGTLPVAVIFFKMVEENMPVADIATEINSQLHKLMPHGMFLVATLIELDVQAKVMSVWAGGMPSSYHLSASGELMGVIHSQHMPLGILSDDEFDSSVQYFEVSENDRFYFCSDGIVESKNSAGELFGERRLKEILLATETQQRFDNLLQALDEFTGEGTPNDDVTFVELTCPAKILPIAEAVNSDTMVCWKFSIVLTEKEIQSLNPVKNLIDILVAMPHISRHKNILHIILSELYCNSLEHSILNINSGNKQDEDSFADYYQQRQNGIQTLADTTMQFDFSTLFIEDNYYLKMELSDSGCGFKFAESENDGTLLHGRGLAIIRDLCEQLQFSEDGRSVKILYKI